MLSTFIKLPVVIKIFILSIVEWAFYTGFTVFLSLRSIFSKIADPKQILHYAALHLGLHCFPKYPFMGFWSKRPNLLNKLVRSKINNKTLYPSTN